MYTKFPNYILDGYLDRLTPAELRVLCYVLRYTVGYQKPAEVFSLAQMIDATGLARRQLLYAVKSLELRRILQVTRRAGQPSRYGVHFAAPGGALYCTGGVQRGAPPVDKRKSLNGYDTETKDTFARVLNS